MKIEDKVKIPIIQGGMGVEFLFQNLQEVLHH